MVLTTNTVFGVPLPSLRFSPVAMGFSFATIEPEENASRNWTMVSPILSYRLQRLTLEAYGFSRS